MAETWDQLDWARMETRTQKAAGIAGWSAVARSARVVLRTYSSSFFIVTRFLPPAKRAEVEVVYACVRYPDEIVDTFSLPAAKQHVLLDTWSADYECGLQCADFAEALNRGCSPFMAAFAQVVQRHGIPHEHYRSFLEAMRLDVSPRRFATLEDLIESYIYGSAIVVGYFLAYIYGPRRPDAWERALGSARNLGIALQLTNFLRDVGDDRRRGRVYLPTDLLTAEGLADVDVNDPSQQAALARVLRRVSGVAEVYYSRAATDVDAFAEDSQIAIRACIDVYRQLNRRIGRTDEGAAHRESVPIAEKFRVLPRSKYWRLPLAYAGVI